MTSELVPAEYRELEVVRDGFPIPSLPFEEVLYMPVPTDWTLPEKIDGKWVDVPYRIKYEELSAPTPKGRIKIHQQGYPYIESDYAKLRLNRAFGYGKWSWVETSFTIGREYKKIIQKTNAIKVYKETICVGYIRAPGIFRTVGVGSAPWAQDDQGDPRFSLATAHNSAESLAVKNAAKKLGIGADVKDDAEASKFTDGQRMTVKSLFDFLVGDGKLDKAKAVIKKISPAALIGDLFDEQRVDEDNLDEMLQKLTDAVN